MHEAAIRSQPSNVAHEIRPSVTAARIRPELRPGQLLLLPVPDGQTAAADRDLSYVPGADFDPGLVQQEHLGVLDGIAHRNAVAHDLGIVVEDVHPDGSDFGGGQRVDEQTVGPEMPTVELEVVAVDGLAGDARRGGAWDTSRYRSDGMAQWRKIDALDR